jgi:hypothetical protein
MALKTVVTDLSQVAEAFRSLYVQRDGKYVLDFEGDAPGFVKIDEHERVKTQLAEFRDNNRALNATKTDLEAKLAAVKDLDPEKYKATQAELEDLRKKAPAKDTELQSIKTQLENLGKSLEDERAGRKKAAEALAEKELESTLTQAALKAGVDEKALPDYLGRAKRVFRIEDGKVKTDAFSKKNVTSAMTLDEFVADLPAEAPHLFKPSHGGGAAPGPGGSGTPGQVRTIAPGARLSEQDIRDIAAGTAVREQAAS